MQKVSEDTQRRINFLFRCDVGKKNEIGTGHLVRSITLAKKLNNDNKFKAQDTIFLINYDSEFSFVKELIKKNNFTLKFINLYNAPPNSIQELEIIKELNPRISIFDRIKTNKTFILKLQRNKLKTVLIDDKGSGLDEADLSICPIFFHRPLKKKIYKGFKYIFFSELKRRKVLVRQKVTLITLVFGGYDKRKLFNFFYKNIKKLGSCYSFNLIFGFEKDKFDKKIILSLSQSKNINLFFRPRNYSDIIQDSDIGIVSGGLTLIEFLSVGIPTIALPQYNHQYITIKKLQQLRCTTLGSKDYKLDWNYFEKKFFKVLNNYNLRKKMSINAKKIIDSKGKERVSKLISKIL